MSGELADGERGSDPDAVADPFVRDDVPDYALQAESRGANGLKHHVPDTDAEDDEPVCAVELNASERWVRRPIDALPESHREPCKRCVQVLNGDGLATDLRDEVTAFECAAMRLLARDGWSKGELKMCTHNGGDAVRNHVTGGCEHSHGVQPLESFRNGD